MIGWTRRVLAAAWVISALLACAGATPEPSTPKLLRSPSLEYGEGVRSASDGEVMGAEQQPAQDWLIGSVTNEHGAPGWSLRDGKPHFTLEQDPHAAGDGSTCLPLRAPLAPEEVRANAAFRRAWLAAARDSSRPAFATLVADLPEQGSRFLTCDIR